MIIIIQKIDHNNSNFLAQQEWIYYKQKYINHIYINVCMVNKLMNLFLIKIFDTSKLIIYDVSNIFDTLIFSDFIII